MINNCLELLMRAFSRSGFIPTGKFDFHSEVEETFDVDIYIETPDGGEEPLYVSVEDSGAVYWQDFTHTTYLGDIYTLEDTLKQNMDAVVAVR